MNNKTHTYLLVILIAVVLVPIAVNILSFVMVTGLALFLKLAPYVLAGGLGYFIMRLCNERNKR